jgi:hypothetical protein
MEPDVYAFAIEALIYIAGSALLFGLGYLLCLYVHRHDKKRAADAAWRMSEAMRRHE